MLGHKLWNICRFYYETYVTVRGPFYCYKHYDLFDDKFTVDNINIMQPGIVQEVIEKVNPDVVINCAGIIKQSQTINTPLESIEINALLPHRLAKICNDLNIRLIHISTDCVFSGKKGSYNENDPSDAEDFYGKTKFLGEVAYGKALTLRTSIIGQELNSQYGLVEWFLAQAGRTVKGYTKAVYSGFTSKVLCGIILNIIERYRDLAGLYHVSSEPIDKFSLLSLIREVYKLDIKIEACSDFVCDRSLNSGRFRAQTNFTPPAWREMITQMYNETAFYSALRRQV